MPGHVRILNSPAILASGHVLLLPLSETSRQSNNRPGRAAALSYGMLRTTFTALHSCVNYEYSSADMVRTIVQGLVFEATVDRGQDNTGMGISHAAIGLNDTSSSRKIR